MDKKWLRHTLSTHHEDAYRWAVQCCYQDDELGKEVLQDVYVKVLEGKAVFREKSSFKTWLFSIIRFTAIDAIKRLGKQTWVGLDAISTHVAEEGQQLVSFDKALSKLSEKQREVLILVFYHDETIESAAAVMDCSIGTARTHYHRGKEKLKELLSDYYERSGA